MNSSATYDLESHYHWSQVIILLGKTSYLKYMLQLPIKNLCFNRTQLPNYLMALKIKPWKEKKKIVRDNL